MSPSGLPNGPGTQGAMCRGGLGPPPGSLGNDGDFYIDTSSMGKYYGPKFAGSWGNQHDLVNDSVFTTGVLGGGQFSINVDDARTFNLTATTAFFANYIDPTSPVIHVVNIPAQSKTLTGDEVNRTVSWWVADANGVLSSLPDPPTATQRRLYIQLGVTAYLPTDAGGLLLAANANPVYLAQPVNQIYDFMQAVGPFIASGSQIAANGANLQFNLTAGSIFSAGAGYKFSIRTPHSVAVVAETPASFFYNTQLSGSETAATAIDPTVYDLEGVVTSVGASSTASTIQRVYVFATSQSGLQLGVQYGQTVYATLAAAKAALASDPFLVSPDFIAANGVLAAFVITSKACTSLTDTATSQIVSAGKFAIQGA